MPHSRLTKKRQTTIPKDICAFLDVDAGDVVVFAIVDGKVILQKSTPFDPEYLRSVQGTLSSEWLSDEDSQAYDALWKRQYRCIIKRMGFLKKKDQKNVVRMMHKEILGE